MLSTMIQKLCSLSRSLSEEYISSNRRQIILSGQGVAIQVIWGRAEWSEEQRKVIFENTFSHLPVTRTESRTVPSPTF